MSRSGKVVLSAAAIYLGIGLILSTWATTTWPKGVVRLPVLVFLQNMLFWPVWLGPAIAMHGDLPD